MANRWQSQILSIIEPVVVLRLEHLNHWKCDTFVSSTADVCDQTLPLWADILCRRWNWNEIFFVYFSLQCIGVGKFTVPVEASDTNIQPHRWSVFLGFLRPFSHQYLEEFVDLVSTNASWTWNRHVVYTEFQLGASWFRFSFTELRKIYTTPQKICENDYEKNGLTYAVTVKLY